MKRMAINVIRTTACILFSISVANIECDIFRFDCLPSRNWNYLRVVHSVQICTMLLTSISFNGLHRMFQKREIRRFGLDVAWRKLGTELDPETDGQHTYNTHFANRIEKKSVCLEQSKMEIQYVLYVLYVLRCRMVCEFSCSYHRWWN